MSEVSDLLAGPAEAEVERLFATSYGRLVNAAAVLVGAQSEAEEVVQDVLANCLDGWRRSGVPDAPERYVVRAVTNRARSRLRRRVVERLRAPRDQLVTYDDVAAIDQLGGPLVLALGNISRRQRECVVLRFMLDMPVVEVASALRISEGAVKSHTHRALERLEGVLAQPNSLRTEEKSW